MLRASRASTLTTKNAFAFAVLSSLALVPPACSSTPATTEPAALGDGGPLSLSLSCPAPGKLPFRTLATTFSSPDSTSASTNDAIAKFEPQDDMGNPTSPQEIRGTFARGTALLGGTIPMAGEWVSLWSSSSGAWKQLSRVKTDENGAYDVTLDDASKQPLGSFLVQAVLEGDASCGTHGSYHWPEGTKIVVTDIDGTMTLKEDEQTAQLTDPTYVVRANKAVDQVMATWKKKGYQVVYLTARPNFLRLVTHAWLASLGIDFGPVITADTLLSGDATTQYKLAALQKLKGFKWDIVAAYGNMPTDIAAYDGAGIPKTQTFTVSPNAGASGTQPIDNNDYTSHLSTYVDKQPDVTPGF